MSPSPRRTFLAALVASTALLTGIARADSTPVGPLPQGPVQTISAKRGQLVALALPKPSSSGGLVWRVARAYDAAVVRQTEEADVGDSTIVVVFKATGSGRTSVIFAQTRGDTGTRALKALRFRITVS
jgi:hypothetical protein